MTLIDFDKKELHDIYSALQYSRLEIGFESKSEEELYDRLTKLMDKVAMFLSILEEQNLFPLKTLFIKMRYPTLKTEKKKLKIP